MNIDDKLMEIAKSDKFKDFTYIYANWYDADELLNRTKLPAIIHLLPVSGDIQRHNGRISDRESCAIAFVDKVPHDANGDDEKDVFVRMKQKATEFLDAIDKSGYFEPVGEYVHYDVIYEMLSDIVTGVMISPDIKEIGHC